MKPSKERHAAKMRLRNSGDKLKDTLASIEAKLQAGSITPGEAAQMRKIFWEGILEDKQRARGKFLV